MSTQDGDESRRANSEAELEAVREDLRRGLSRARAVLTWAEIHLITAALAVEGAEESDLSDEARMRRLQTWSDIHVLLEAVKRRETERGRSIDAPTSDIEPPQSSE